MMDALDGFVPIGEKPEPIMRIDRAEARTGYRVFRGEDGFEAAIPETVVERMVAFGRAAAPKEWFGLIAARICEDDCGRHLVVLGVVPDPDAVAHPYYIETTPDSELRTRLALRTLYPDGSVVGWVHGHVRVGAQYSATDRRTQATWDRVHSLGVVCDPWDPRQIAVYRGPECEELALVREDEIPARPAAVDGIASPAESALREEDRPFPLPPMSLLGEHLGSLPDPRTVQRTFGERLVPIITVALAAVAVVLAVMSQGAADRADRQIREVAQTLADSQVTLRMEIAAWEGRLDLLIEDALVCEASVLPSSSEPASAIPSAPAPTKRGGARRGTSPRVRNAGIARAMKERTRSPLQRETPP